MDTLQTLAHRFREEGFVRRLVEQGKLSPEHYKEVNVHVVEAQDELRPLVASSKLNAEWAFLRHLFEIGRRAAEHWLGQHYEAIGERSTVDIHAMFQGIGAQHQG